jgi:uncharacterized membrane protein
VAPATSFAALLDAAFNQIRQYSRTSAAVTIRLLETIAVIVPSAPRTEDRAALRRHAEMIARGGRAALPEILDQHDVEERFQEVCRLLNDKVATGEIGVTE